MKKLSKILFLSLIAASTFQSCSDDDIVDPTPTTTLNLSFNGLEDLGSDYAYEGWIMVNGTPVSTGIFNVDASGNLSQTAFELNSSDLDVATAFILTIEPSPDMDPAPSSVHILAGDFNGNTSDLTVNHSAAIGNDFTAATGSYILATPTNDDTDDENSGVWWLDNSAASGPVAGLDLPTLPDGWIYEGWAVIDGTPVSTGRFSTVSGSDDFSAYSGLNDSPPFPGEDFLVNAPGNLSFPVDLSGKTVVISVEPVPDNSTAPFALKPLVGQVAADAAVHTVLAMDNNATATNPTGSASR